MLRPRAADDFEIIRARVEELRLERARALAGQKLGAAAGEDNRKDERRLPRSVLLRKVVR